VRAKKTHVQVVSPFKWFPEQEDIQVPLCSPYAIGQDWEFSSEPTCKTCLRMIERQMDFPKCLQLSAGPKRPPKLISAAV
jgi:hypothetical protein